MKNSFDRRRTVQIRFAQMTPAQKTLSKPWVLIAQEYNQNVITM